MIRPAQYYTAYSGLTQPFAAPWFRIPLWTDILPGLEHVIRLLGLVLALYIIEAKLQALNVAAVDPKPYSPLK